MSDYETELKDYEKKLWRRTVDIETSDKFFQLVTENDDFLLAAKREEQEKIVEKLAEETDRYPNELIRDFWKRY